MNKIAEQFKKYRHCSAHHLGLGDIRLSVGEQEEIAAMLPVWRSIESAPRDGTFFLALTEGAKIFTTGWELDERGEHGGWAGPNTPKYWMPLPEPPDGV